MMYYEDLHGPNHLLPQFLVAMPGRLRATQERLYRAWLHWPSSA